MCLNRSKFLFFFILDSLFNRAPPPLGGERFLPKYIPLVPSLILEIQYFKTSGEKRGGLKSEMKGDVRGCG